MAREQDINFMGKFVLKRGSKFGPRAAQTQSKNARVRPGLLDIPIERPVGAKHWYGVLVGLAKVINALPVNAEKCLSV